MNCRFLTAVAGLLLIASAPLTAAQAAEAKIRREIQRLEDQNRAEWLNIAPEDGEMLCALVKQNDAKNVLVIAGPVGYSTLWIAMGVMETGGSITYLQEKPEQVARAREVFKNAGVEELVTVIQGNPHDYVAGVERPVDLAFLDADKGGNQDYLHKIVPMLRPGSLLIAHDTLSEPKLVKNYLAGLGYIRKLSSVTLDAGGNGMTITVVRRDAPSLSGRIDPATYTPPGPKLRKVAEIPGNAVLGYINHVPPETPEQRKLRHKRVAERRNRDVPILVHRGDDSAAPENTLEAYMAAIDRGADGVEIDIRRSKDGVLYFLHDGSTGRVADTSIEGDESTYYQLLQAGLKPEGRADKDTRIPTLCSFLELARRHAMLIHLDVKEGGLERDIAGLLDAFDMWDHLVAVNAGNAIPLRYDPMTTLLVYKGGWNRDKRTPAEVRLKRLLERPGDMITCEYAKEAPRVLNRERRPETPIPADVRIWWTPDGPVQIEVD